MDQLASGRHRSSGRRRRQPPQRGNAVAIALAALAVVLAGTGTAVAVTSTTTISDPSYPTRIARIDPFGRLTTAGPVTTLSIAATNFTTASKNLDLFSAPTTATLAVSKFSVTVPSNAVGRYGIYFFQVPVLANGTCSLTTTTRSLGYASASPGQTAVQDFTVPLAVRPVSGAKYCLDLFATAENSSSAPASELLNMSISGYVASGSYTGVGTGATPAKTLNKAKVTGSR